LFIISLLYKIKIDKNYNDGKKAMVFVLLPDYPFYLPIFYNKNIQLSIVSKKFLAINMKYLSKIEKSG